MAMVKSNTTFSLPVSFTGNPTEAPFPRQLIVYDEDSDTWNSTVEDRITAHTRYLCVSYRQSDFPLADRDQLELDVQAVCLQFDLTAYWLDYACTGSSQEEKNMDLYRIADVFRGATKTLIMIKGSDNKPHSPGWISWGDRLWTLPEALLSGYSGDKLVYRAGKRKAKPITLREIANHAYKDGDGEMTLVNNYAGEPTLQPNVTLESLIKAIWRRSSGPGKGKEKGGAFTAYDAERVYALMGFMAKRIRPDPNEGEEEAFRRLMKENRLHKDLRAILNSSEESIPINMPMIPSMDSEPRVVLDKIPYTGGMRYDTGKRCLDGTRVGIIEDIINCMDNKDGMYSGKRVFLLTGVAGSGKSSIAHSIATHYDDKKQLGSSFFFSVAYKEKSQPKNLLRTIARDIADKYPAVQRKLYDVVKDNLSLCTTDSIQEQYEKFLRDPLSGGTLDDPIAIVIDALDECYKNGDERRRLTSILAKEMPTLPCNLRVFLTARAEAEFEILYSSPYVEMFTIDGIQSKSKESDIRTFFRRTLESKANMLSRVDENWEEHLTEMSGNLFIYATTACNYILENDGRSPGARLKTLLSSKKLADFNSPVAVLYNQYREVLSTIYKVRDSGRPQEILDQALEGFRRVLGTVLVAYEPLASNDMDILLDPHDEAMPIISQMGTLLSGSSDPDLPVRPLHKSFGDFLQDKASSGIFCIDLQQQHGEMAKNCFKVMKRGLRFNIFDLKDVSVPTNSSDRQHAREILKSQISKALQYSCQYWPSHITHMRKDDFGLIEEPLQQFLFEYKHMMCWIEVISGVGQAKEARDALLSLYRWLNEINSIDKQIPHLILECYHLLRCFHEAIVAGPLQVYVSALPYLPPESLLHVLHKGQAMFSLKVLLGHIKDNKLFSPTFPLSGDYPSAVAFSNDGTRIAILFDVRLEIWDCATFSQIGDPITSKNQNHSGNLVVFSPDGSKIAILCVRSIEIWDLSERRLLVSQTASGGAKYAAIAFPDDAHLLYCQIQSTDIEVSERDILTDRTETYKLQTGGTLSRVALSSNARYMGSISEMAGVTVWDLNIRKVISTYDLGGSEDSYRVLAISNDKEHVACGSFLNTVQLWNLRTGSLVCQLTGKGDYASRQILMPLSPDSNRFITTSDNFDVYMWDTTSGFRYVHESSAYSFSIAALSPDGRHLVTLSSDECKVWALEVSKGIADMNGATLSPGEALAEVVFLQDGNLIASAVGDTPEKSYFVVWDKFGTASASRQILEGHESVIQGFRFSRDGKTLLSWDDDNNIILWGRDGEDVRFSLRKKQIDHEGVRLEDAVLLPNGGILVAGSKEKEIVVWDSFGSRQVIALEGWAYYVRVSSDGTRLINCDAKHNVFVWCRDSDDFRFKLQDTRKCDEADDARKLSDELASWQSENIPEDSQSLASYIQTEGGSNGNIGKEKEKGSFFDYNDRSRWVCLANDRRRLWHIPNGFEGYPTGWDNYGLCKHVQEERKIVVYGPHFAILFEYKDDFVRTLLK